MFEEKDSEEGLLYLWKCQADVALKSSSIFHKKPIIKVAIGYSHCAFLTRDQDVYCYGNNNYGQLGIGSLDNQLESPQMVEDLRGCGVIDVEVGTNHTAVTCHTGDVFCWGDTRFGQCARKEQDKVSSPQLVVIIENTGHCEHGVPKVTKKVNICQVGCGEKHTLALTDDGELWTWGSGCQLGLANVGETFTPQKVEYFGGRKVLSISCGDLHSLALVKKLPKVQGKSLKARADSADILTHDDQPSTCAKCKQEIYTMTDLNDTCVISTEHSCGGDLCPLGLEVEEGEMPNRGVSRSASVDKLAESPRDSSKSDSRISPPRRSISEPSAHSKPGSQAELRLGHERTKSGISGVGSSILKSHTSTFLDEAEAKEFLERQLSGSCEVDLLQQQTKNSVIRDKIENLWSNVTQPSAIATQVSNEISSMRNRVVTNIRRMSQGFGGVTFEDFPKSASQDSITVQSSTDVSPLRGKSSSDVSTMSPGEQDNVYSLSMRDSSIVLPEDDSKKETLEGATDSGVCSEGLDTSQEEPTGSAPDAIFEASTDLDASKLLKAKLEFRFSPANSLTSSDQTLDDSVESSKESLEGEGVSHTGGKGMSPTSSKESLNTDQGNLQSSESPEKIVPVIMPNANGHSGSMTKIMEIKSEHNKEKTVARQKPDPQWKKMPVLERMGSLKDKQEGRKISVKRLTEILNELPKKLEEPEDACIETEVWSWGRGKCGQLGHGDMLDRPQPSCVKILSNKHIIKVVAGAKHSLALTCNSQVFAWGQNDNYQLGHNECPTITPNKIKGLNNCLIWDISAGQLESLLSAYQNSHQPEIYFCGIQDRFITGLLSGAKMGTESVVQAEYVPKRLSQLKKVGWVKQITAGSQMCASIVDKTSGLIALLHEFSASERSFFNQLENIYLSVIRPLVSTDVYSAVDTSTCGEAIKDLFDTFANVMNMVGINIVQVTQVIQGDQSLYQIYMLSHPEETIQIFNQFSHSFGNVLAMGGFEFLAKTAGTFLEKLQDVFAELLEEGRVDKMNCGITFRRLMQIPLRRLKDYKKQIKKFSMDVAEDTEEHEHLTYICALWDALIESAKIEHTSCENTRIFWEASPAKLVDSLRGKGRRLIRESKTNSLTLYNAGRFAAHWFFLFSDVFVHSHYSSTEVFPLQSIWMETLSDTDQVSNAIQMITPENQLTLIAPTACDKSDWLWAINQAVDKVLMQDKNNVGKRNTIGGHVLPPLTRHGISHTFLKSGLMKDATYKGSWYSGKMNGNGELTWMDGRKYTGKFKNGLQHGQGVNVVPKTDSVEVYEGNLKDGKMHGFGCIRYANGDVYTGYFREGQRHGHGVLKQGSLNSTSLASIYIGEWLNDKKYGYGVVDDILKGEKYMGMWMEDNRQGAGIVVTLDGMYFEGNFQQNKLTGYGLMMTDDNSCYEGEFNYGTQLYGKGVLTFPNGDTMDGQFTGAWSEGIKVNGLLKKATVNVKEAKGFSHALGIIPKTFGALCVPPDRKWEGIFDHCRAILRCQAGNGKPDCNKAWEMVAVMVSAGKKALRDSENRMSPRSRVRSEGLEELEMIPPRSEGLLTVENYHQINSYLKTAFNTSFHPLGKLMESLVDVYRATYVGVGAHPRLLHHAVLEIKSYIVRMYYILRVLFPELPETDMPCQIFPEGKTPEAVEGDDFTLRAVDEESEDGSEVITATGILHSFLLPKVYPPLFTLYALYNEREDERYWERVQRLNRQSDMALLSYLGVDGRFWPMDDLSVDLSKQKAVSTIRDQCYKGAVESLQQLSTAFCPAEKLDTIRNTFNDLNRAVQKMLGDDYLWCMDDLFPVFQYVVVRARIRHLGAEIHFIDDLMEAHLELGELGIMFTTLKASYFQIQNEKILL
ncbi:alsin-like isoform X2 [Lineus longissimus]|uniref:alsin-like isoform X2 n=1 Tax=Lineus longissimus TaxID=88925 RepID=UPI00315DFD50